jgi:hypothetical protein
METLLKKIIEVIKEHGVIGNSILNIESLDIRKQQGDYIYLEMVLAPRK